MKKIVFQNEKEFTHWRDEVLAYNQLHGYSSVQFYLENPKEYPVMAIYRFRSYVVDAHCAPATEYDVTLVYPSDFNPKCVDELLLPPYIKPEEFDNLAGMILCPKQSEELDEAIHFTKFEKAMRDAEYNGIENFRKSMMNGQRPTRWRIKIDGHFPESDIQYAVSRYRDAGWKQVQYNFVERSADVHSHSNGYWIITINVKVGE